MSNCAMVVFQQRPPPASRVSSRHGRIRGLHGRLRIRTGVIEGFVRHLSPRRPSARSRTAYDAATNATEVATFAAFTTSVEHFFVPVRRGRAAAVPAGLVRRREQVALGALRHGCYAIVSRDGTIERARALRG